MKKALLIFSCLLYQFSNAQFLINVKQISLDTPIITTVQ